MIRLRREFRGAALLRGCLFIFALVLSARASPTTGPWRFSFTEGPATEGEIKVGASDRFSRERGYGFDLDTTLKTASAAVFFSVAVPEGNYRVTLSLAPSSLNQRYTIKAESRQLLLENVAAQNGVLPPFIINVRNARIPPPEKNAPGGAAVLLNEREAGLLRWDDKLTLEIHAQSDGASSSSPTVELATLAIERVNVPTVFLAGDSTVTDQPNEPAASWGQMLPRFLTGVAVANHAESGETMKSFISGLRLAKILSQIKAGDFLFIQFGHNDEKKNWPQTYVDASTTYKAYLKVFIAEARLRGANPVLVTSMQRRTFDPAGKIRNTHGDYPQAVRDVAGEEAVPLIDLERMSVAFYEALGPQRAPLAFSADGKDATHHNNYGAYELAKAVAQGLREVHSPLAHNVVADLLTFDPAKPDVPEQFRLVPSPHRSEATLRGN